MAFEPGHEKMGGRQKGTPNKINRSLRNWIKDILQEGQEQFEKDLKKLSPKDRVDATIKLLEFSLPKLTRSQIEDISFDVEGFLRLSKEERLRRIADFEKNQIKKKLKQYGGRD